MMQIDADQHFDPDFFIKLWEGIQEHGDDTIITGWATCKTGKFANEPSIFRVEDHDIVSVSKEELEASPTYIDADSYGSCGFLMSTKLLEKIHPPWWADVNLIREDIKVHGAFVGTEFTLGQDVVFGARVKEAGGSIKVRTDAFMPHEVIRTI